MDKTAYLIVTDLHMSYKNKDSRINYIKEVKDCVNKLISVGLKYKKEGYKVIITFLGDIVDNSYKSQTEAIILNNTFVKLNELFDKIYSVLGNHEQSYYIDNPFWSLLNTLDSNKIPRVLNKAWQPTGLLQLINIVDTLEDGNVIFHFNHHSTEINRPVPGKVNIGLFHKDIVSKAIIKDMTENRNLDIFEGSPLYFDNSNILYGYDYAFFGHMHKIYGTWDYIDDKTGYRNKLYYLGSLGRPNQTEVQDSFLERNIPAVILEDNKFSRIEDNKFNLPSREESVIEKVVIEKQTVYQEAKAKKVISTYLTSDDNPVQNIRNVLLKFESTLKLFDKYIEGDYASIEHELDNRIEDVKWL